MSATISNKKSIDIGDLIYEIMTISDREFEEVEKAAFDADFYPDPYDRYISLVDGNAIDLKKLPQLEWLNSALVKILNNLDVDKIIVDLD